MSDHPNNQPSESNFAQVIFPDVALRTLWKRYVALAVTAMFFAVMTQLMPPNSDIKHLVFGMSLGLVIAVGLFHSRDWGHRIMFAEVMRDMHFKSHQELALRRKVQSHVYKGCVYVLQDMDVTGWYKIGKTTQPARRIGHFDTMLPFQTRVVHIIETKNCDAVEAMMHRHFASKRRRAEWFELDDADVAWLIKMKAV